MLKGNVRISEILKTTLLHIVPSTHFFPFCLPNLIFLPFLGPYILSYEYSLAKFSVDSLKGLNHYHLMIQID